MMKRKFAVPQQLLQSGLNAASAVLNGVPFVRRTLGLQGRKAQDWIWSVFSL